MENNSISILKQGWYKEIQNKWHADDEFNYVGEHVTYVDLGSRTVDEVKTVWSTRNCMTTVTIQFNDAEDTGVYLDKKSNGYFHYNLMKNPIYLDATFDEINSNILRVRVELCWYTLGYSYYLIANEMDKHELMKL